MCAVDEKFDVVDGGTADAFYVKCQALAAEQKKKQAERVAGQKRQKEQSKKKKRWRIVYEFKWTDCYDWFLNNFENTLE